MEAQELRIGNLVYHNDEIIEIKSLHTQDDDVNDEIPFHAVYGIPLTEEWLLKFGFVIRDKNHSLNYGGESMRFAILETNIKNPFILYFHGRFGFNTESGRKNGDFCINHVHQLQNLYFALTNTELTLKQI